jgi:equilibrative nucleoside transporter 1/2/3
MLIMDRMRTLLTVVDEQEYEPLRGEAGDADDETVTSLPEDPPFSWFEYTVFLLLGIAMLWAW